MTSPYKEILSGETHHAAFFRLQIEDTAVNGMDYIILDADGQIAEVAIFRRPLPSTVEMQAALRLSSACGPGNCAPRGNDDRGMSPMRVQDLIWDPVRHE
jgi:hypothetical protein